MCHVTLSKFRKEDQYNTEEYYAKNKKRGIPYVLLYLLFEYLRDMDLIM